MVAISAVRDIPEQLCNSLQDSTEDNAPNLHLQLAVGFLSTIFEDLTCPELLCWVLLLKSDIIDRSTLSIPKQKALAVSSVVGSFLGMRSPRKSQDGMTSCHADSTATAIARRAMFTESPG